MTLNHDKDTLSTLEKMSEARIERRSLPAGLVDRIKGGCEVLEEGKGRLHLGDLSFSLLSRPATLLLWLCLAQCIRSPNLLLPSLQKKNTLSMSLSAPAPALCMLRLCHEHIHQPVAP